MLAMSDDDSRKSPTPDSQQNKGAVSARPADPPVKPNFVYVVSYLHVFSSTFLFISVWAVCIDVPFPMFWACLLFISVAFSATGRKEKEVRNVSLRPTLLANVWVLIPYVYPRELIPHSVNYDPIEHSYAP